MNDPIVKPFSGFVVIEAIKEETTSTGLINPDANKDQTQKGVVVAVGEPRIDFHNGSTISTTCPASVGDKVVYKKYSNQTVSNQGKEYEVVEFGDLIAKL